MTSNIGLWFLENTGGDAEGLSDAGIETFRAYPFAAAARETGQNSRDVRYDATKPVRLTFDIVTIKSDEFPSIDQFRKAAQLCLKKSDKPKNEKEKGFFEQAVKVLNEPDIRILKISDFNTKGVHGPCEEGQPFHSLAKSDGVSTKDDINSGGSYGIGKNAVFALSDIQTAIFSTRYRDSADSAEHILCMGKTLFISHEDETGSPRRRKGYWSKEGYMPLDSADEIPAWLVREEQGTSIFSVCMRESRTDWRYEMTAAVIINFFCAIERKEMEFEIDGGKIKINRATLQPLFQDPKVREVVKKLNEEVSFETAKTLHQCLIDEKSINEVLDVEGLGKVSMRILLRDGLGYTIGIIRNGMYITDNLTFFNEPFKRFPLHREFSIVVEPHGATESEWFKRLEGPQHNDLSAERIPDPSLREKGQKAFNLLAKKIRKRIRELARTEPIGRVELDELSDFFASEETRQEDEAGPNTDPKALKLVEIKRSSPRPQNASTAANPEDDQQKTDAHGGLPPTDEFGSKEGEGSGHGTENNPMNPGERKGGRPQAQAIRLDGERNLILNIAEPQKRRLYFTPPSNGSMLIEIRATGLTRMEPLNVVAAIGGDIQEGKIKILCEKGKRSCVDVEFDIPYTGPLETAALLTPSVEDAK